MIPHFLSLGERERRHTIVAQGRLLSSVNANFDRSQLKF
jgi:hypothetical protein